MTTTRTINNGGATVAIVSPDGTITRELQGDHVIVFPFMAKGHTIPLLHLSVALSNRGLRVTVITTPANVPFLRSHLQPIRHPLVHFLTIPFPNLPPIPAGVESTDSLPSFDLYPTFLRATALLRDDFHRLLVQLVSSDGHAVSPPAPPPLCLISDFFLGWTLPLCQQLGLPRLVFHGMSAFAMGLSKALWVHRPFSDGDATFHVPGAPPSLLLTQDDVPTDIRRSSYEHDPVVQFLSEVGSADVSSWGVVVNSFAELDRGHVELFESFYPDGARGWLVGPLCLLSGNNFSAGSDPEGCLEWLDGRAGGSVVFVSFGTQANVTDDQLDEVAHGLTQAGHDFLWVVRSKTWTPPDKLGTNGKIVMWAPQREVLAHVAVGAFLTHCGWNSVLESLSAGVPMLCWPMIAEQPLNAKHVVEILGAGVRLRPEAGKVLRREAVAKWVREVMGEGESGVRARKRADELRRAAEDAVAEGGSSHAALEELLAKLRGVKGKG